MRKYHQSIKKVWLILLTFYTFSIFINLVLNSNKSVNITGRLKRCLNILPSATGVRQKETRSDKYIITDDIASKCLANQA